jgi:hypothetical protein
VYNASCLNIFRNFAEFVALHYALSVRNDTEYWRANSSRTYSPGLPYLEPQSFQGFYELQHIKMFTARVPMSAGITLIAVGMNYPLLDNVTRIHQENRDGISYKEKYKESFETFEKKKEYWAKLAETEPTLYQYLKDNIYKN